MSTVQYKDPCGLSVTATREDNEYTYQVHFCTTTTCLACFKAVTEVANVVVHQGISFSTSVDYKQTPPAKVNPPRASLLIKTPVDVYPVVHNTIMVHMSKDRVYINTLRNKYPVLCTYIHPLGADLVREYLINRTHVDDSLLTRLSDFENIQGISERKNGNAPTLDINVGRFNIAVDSEKEVVTEL